MFKLSINTIKSFRIAYADLTVAASSVSANSVERFFLTPIWLCGSRAYSSAISTMRSAILNYLLYNLNRSYIVYIKAQI
jgi:hypothetical protein